MGIRPSSHIHSSSYVKHDTVVFYIFYLYQTTVYQLARSYRRPRQHCKFYMNTCPYLLGIYLIYMNCVCPNLTPFGPKAEKYFRNSNAFSFNHLFLSRCIKSSYLASVWLQPSLALLCPRNNFNLNQQFSHWILDAHLWETLSLPFISPSSLSLLLPLTPSLPPHTFLPWQFLSFNIFLFLFIFTHIEIVMDSLYFQLCTLCN